MKKNGGVHPKGAPRVKRSRNFVYGVGEKRPRDPLLGSYDNEPQSKGGVRVSLTVIYAVRSPAAWRGGWGVRSPIGSQPADTLAVLSRGS